MSYKLSLLIPGWNAEDYIGNCVNSLLENDYYNFEILLITGGSDNSYNISLKLKENYPNKIKVLKQEIPNKNIALNLGLSEAEGDIIVLTDIDCVYQKNWLRTINEIFQNKNYNVITGLYLPFSDRKNSLAEFNRIKIGSSLFKFKDNSIVVGNKLCGANAAFRKEKFLKKIGKFDESVRTGDDKILGIAFNKKGEDLYYFRDIYVYTECYSNSIRKFIKRRIRWAKDLFLTLEWKHVIKLLVLFCLFLFILFYPLAVILFWILFLNFHFLWFLFLLFPWLLFFVLYLTYFYQQLKKLSLMVNKELSTNFNYKRAFKIVPLLFFAYGIITIMSLIYPKRKKW